MLVMRMSSHWALLPERPVRLVDFPDFEMTTLAHCCDWEKLIERPHLIYEGLVREFYAYFNRDIDMPGTDHQNQTWVRDTWVILSPEVITDYFELTQNDIVSILGQFLWPEVATLLFGRDNAWPL